MTVTLATNGLSAVEAVVEASRQGTPFDLVLMDANMDGLDGYGAIEKIRAEECSKAIPIMMLTSNRRVEDVKLCKLLGIEHYLVKPIQRDELKKSIAEALESDPGPEKEPAAEHPNPFRDVPTALHVLVAEDNPVNQTVIEHLLRKMNCTVESVASGVEALELVRQKRFDAVFMDIQMPRMDGFEATARIRLQEHTYGGHLPIVALTAHATDGYRERCLLAGMDDYIAKPVQVSELSAMLKKLAKMKQVTDTDCAITEVNFEEALSHVGGDRELFNELSQIFRADCPTVMAEMKSAITTSNADALRRAAHRLKGSFGVLGAAHSEDLASRLEQLGSSGEMDGAPELYEQLDLSVGLLVNSLFRIGEPQHECSDCR